MRTWRSLFPGRLRSRKSLESTVYVTTFLAALVTVSVSASTILPCPANGYGPLKDRLHPKNRGAILEESEKQEPCSGYVPEQLPIRGLGQRAYLTKRDGWIEIDQRPSFFSWRRWTSAYPIAYTLNHMNDMGRRRRRATLQDVMLISMVLSGIKRNTGLTVALHRIRHTEVRKMMSAYLEMGEWVRTRATHSS